MELSHSSETHTAAVRDALADVRSRWRMLTRLRLAAVVAAATAVVWLVAWAIVRILTLGGGALTLVGLCALVISIAVVALALVRRQRIPGDRAFARYIEEQCPALEDRLATAVEVVRGSSPAHAGIRSAMLADASRALGEVSLATIVPPDRVRRAGLLAGAAGVALMAAAALWIEPGRQALRLAALYVVPGRLVLQVSPGNARVKRGNPFEIRVATMAGEGGIAPALTVTIGDQRRTVGMQAAGGDRFAWRFGGVPASFTYSVSAAGRTSETYTVTAVDPPSVARIDLRYELPEYTRLPPRHEEDGGDIYAPNGTRVTLSIQASKGATSGALSLVGGARVPLQQAADGRFRATLPITADGAYRVALTDADGLASDGDTEYFIRVLNDRPPDVRILRPAGDRQVTPLEEITIEARADDDYGVGAFDLVYSVRGAGEKAVPFEGDLASLSVTGRHTLYLEDLGVKPGDFVTYYARVRDVARGRRSTEARSDIFFLEVKPFEEEFASAQSQAGGGGSGNRSLDDLVTAQKDIVVATWKLDRRTGAGRSAQDVRAIGRAQGELKERAERAAAQMREPRRRSRVVQGDTIGPSREDPMPSAAAAMGRAKAALDAVKTAEALPAEMEALNHLLRAQAEIKRREVMRQQANGAGSGGSNRSQQDLSTLFDRELQRQQQTNYETQKSTEERQDNNRDTALDRVRELARRQEQLARQQEDLARERQRLSADELKRRLERLTREQSELRQQAEELSRQMGQQQARQQAEGGQRGQQQGGSGGQKPQGQAQAGDRPGGDGASGGQSPQGQSAGGGSQLREASEQMRGAASDLRRQDPRQASTRASRALEQLRSLERQLQGAQPDERRRALGDLQLEARQLAERQRELAEQAAAAARASNTHDARRRVAGDQDRLADRLKRLEEQVKGVAATAEGAEPQARQAVGEAARQIEQDRLETRMRESADALRAAGQQDASAATARAASTGRQLARSMDRVADRLGDASGSRNADDRKLSDQLARTRELKEDINELQRRMQRLERDGQGGTPQRAEGNRDSRQGQAAEAARSDPTGTGGGARAGQEAGNTPQGGQPGAGDGSRRELQQLQQQYAERMREADKLRQELGGMRQAGRQGTTPEGQEMVGSAPGTEAFKQDFSRWELLHKDVTLGLERLEASLSQALLERAARDRLKAGGADRAPDEYERAVDAYFRSLAAPKP